MEETKLRIKGLFSQPNVYSQVPEGALRTADNVVIDREGVASPRRGFDNIGGFGGSSVFNSIVEFQNKLVGNYSTGLLGYYDGSAWTNIAGSYPAPTGTRTRFAPASQNLYFTTTTGVKKMEAYTSAPGAMGVPKAIHAVVATTGTTGTVILTGNSVAYRYLWGIKDANNNLIYGAPSQRTEIAYAGDGTADVTHTVYIPDGITTTHFLQVYRSKSATSPSDDLYLVYESSPVGADITAKVMPTFTDATPASLLGATLYTSPAQEGILQANDQPPLADDIEIYSDRLFFANTKTKHRYIVSLLATGGTNGLIVNDTIIIAGVTYTAKAAETVASGQFLVTYAGTSLGSAALDIAGTAKSLINVINRYTSNTLVYAYYISSVDDLPGKILIEERGTGGSAFNTQVSRATAWSPEGLDVAQASSNDDWDNGLFYSKPGQPESVPILNYQRIGSANDPILRIKALRDSLFVFKKTEGIYRITGDSAPFKVDLFDSSVRLLAPETLAVLNNQIFGLFDQGVGTVSETGVNIVSRPIEKTILELQGAALAQVKSLSWAVSYESDRKYILNVPANSAATYTTQAYVYNHATEAWTRWLISKSCGLARPSDDMLYVGDALLNRVSVERKSYTYRDHVDEPLSRSIVSISGLNLTLDDTTDLAVGDVMYSSSTVFAVITAVSGLVVTVGYDPGFVVGLYSILKAFTSTVEWQPYEAGNPMSLKHFRECRLMFEKQPKNATISFYTDLARAEGSVDLTGYSTALWGTFPWGSASWGGGAGEKVFRTYVTRDHQRGNTLRVKWKHAIGYSNWALSGADVVFNQVGSRSTR